MQKLSVGVSSWIIQDENYGDFAVGETAKFALEFAGNKLTSCAAAEKTAQLITNSEYRVRAQVVFVTPEVWVIDFGMLAFWESKPPANVVIGSWVEGDIYIGIDPFFYKEYLHKIPNMPRLTYNWKVEVILREDTPWLGSTNDRGGVTLKRDKTREAWGNVERTNAWEEDGLSANYVLNCQKLN